MKKAQSIMEYTVLMIIILAAFLTMQIYVKRGFQGRWKQSVDELGDQYDAATFSGNTHYAANTVSESRISTLSGVIYNGDNGMITYRTDTSSGTESGKSDAFIGY